MIEDEMRTHSFRTANILHQDKKWCISFCRLLLPTSKERGLQALDGKSLTLGGYQIMVLFDNVFSLLLSTESTEVHACTPCPAGVAGSAWVVLTLLKGSVFVYFVCMHANTYSTPGVQLRHMEDKEGCKFCSVLAKKFSCCTLEMIPWMSQWYWCVLFFLYIWIWGREAWLSKANAYALLSY